MLEKAICCCCTATDATIAKKSLSGATELSLTFPLRCLAYKSNNPRLATVWFVISVLVLNYCVQLLFTSYLLVVSGCCLREVSGCLLAAGGLLVDNTGCAVLAVVDADGFVLVGATAVAVAVVVFTTFVAGISRPPLARATIGAETRLGTGCGGLATAATGARGGGGGRLLYFSKGVQNPNCFLTSFSSMIPKS